MIFFLRYFHSFGRLLINVAANSCGNLHRGLLMIYGTPRIDASHMAYVVQIFLLIEENRTRL